MAMRYVFTFLSTLAFLQCFLISFSLTGAFPTGAGGCAEQFGSVGGSHLQRLVTINGTISDFGLAVDLANITMENDQTYPIYTHTKYNVFLYTPGDNQTLQFRGFLFRLTKADINSTVGFIEPPDLSNGTLNEQEAQQCTNINIGGVTHINSDLKNFVSAVIEVPEGGDYTLQVTAVILNRALNASYSISQWYWSRYTLSAALAPTAAPTRSPAPSLSFGGTGIPATTPAPATGKATSGALLTNGKVTASGLWGVILKIVALALF